MKAIVTGGAGFIGSHLVDALIKEGWNVDIIDNLSTGNRENVNKRATLHHLDIRSKEAKEVILSMKPNYVFHLAAQADVAKSIKQPQFDADINILGTVNLLEACVEANVEKIIFSSTSGVYGNLQKEVIEETDPTLPISYYGLSKLSAESYIRIFAHLYGQRYTVLRYGNVYGPRQSAKGEGGVIAIFTDKVQQSLPLTVNGDGEQTRDFIFVNDVVHANIAATKEGDDDVFHVSTGKGTSVNKLVNILTDIHQNQVQVKNTPPRLGDIKHSCLDNQKAEQQLKWKPTFDIHDGLSETYHYLKAKLANEYYD